MKLLQFTWLLLAPGILLSHDLVPGRMPESPVALVNATIYPVSSSPIQNGILLFDNGKIVGIGESLEIPNNATRIDVAGKHVYPGLISANSSIGLIEIDAVRATRDMTEPGVLNPNARAESAVNPDSEMIPVTRANGVLIAHVSPTTGSSGLIGGTTAAMALDGWTHVDMTVKAPVAMALNWPKAPEARSFDLYQTTSHSAKRYKENYQKRIKLLEDSFNDCRAYWKAKQAGEEAVDVDLRWEALKVVLDREVPVVVRAVTLRQINDAIEWSDREDIRIILLEAQDAWYVADLLAEKEIPVIAGSINELPLRRWESYDISSKNVLKLHEAGVLYAIGFGGRGARHGVEKNLPYEAAKVASFGLSQEDALKSITINAARILGIDDRVGTLEVGKDATLIVTTGDPMDIRTQVEMAFIGGRSVDLSSKHTQLNEKYKQKYGQE